TEQGSKLVGTGSIGNGLQGVSVALSADGNTAAVGGYHDNSFAGAVWIFTRSGTTWTQQGSKWVGTGWAGGAGQGVHVSLWSNGNLRWEGGPADDTSAGASWAFVRSSGAWSQLGSKLVGTGAVNGSMGAQQGVAVALSSDGLTAIAGGNLDDSSIGAAWIFTQTLPTLPSHAIGDFDGDHKTDATIYKTNGVWGSLKSTTGYTASSLINWSAPGYLPVRGDFDGDGHQDPALYNPSTGNWRILTSSSSYSTSFTVNWGGAGYTPVPGDYDGDGKADIAVYNVSTGAWLIVTSGSGYASTIIVNYGGPGYMPIGGQDFDGDLIADVAVYQPSTGIWAVLKSSTAFVLGFSVSWGGPGYTLVPRDSDGDHRADLGIYQPSTGGWHILTSSSGFTSTISASWGGPGYLPVPGDYDGDGSVDPAVYQRATGFWYVLKSSTAYGSTLSIGAWGSGNDIPLSQAIAVRSNDLLRAGDADADARSEIIVYAEALGLWGSLTSSSNYVAT